MKQKFLTAGLILLAFAAPVSASAQAVLQGHWKNPKGSVIVRLGPCGNAICGVVAQASDKAKASALKGGTPNLIGTRILSGLHPMGNGMFRGQIFDPKRNIHAAATVQMAGHDAFIVRGCAIAGMFLCKEQRWTRVG